MSDATRLASDGTAYFNAASQPKRRWLVFLLGLALGFALGAFLF